MEFLTAICFACSGCSGAGASGSSSKVGSMKRFVEGSGGLCPSSKRGLLRALSAVYFAARLAQIASIASIYNVAA